MSEVKLPRSVRNQIQAAEKIEQQMAASVDNAPVTVSVEALGTAVTEPAVQAPAVPEPTVIEPSVPVTPQTQDALALAEQRYRTLQGMMQADVGTLRAQVKAATDRNEALTLAVSKLTEQIKSAPASTAAMDPKDVEAFGADLVDMVRRQSSAEIEQAVQATMAGILSRLDGLEQTVQVTGQSVAVNAEQQFYSAVTARVPDWRAVNADQRFLEWLGEVDSVYGIPRQAALDNAVNQGSVDRTAAIFEAFKKAAAPAPAQANSLQSQVAPARSGGSNAPSAPAAPQLVSEKDIVRFYNDMRLGRFRGKEAEAAQIEGNINQAVAEGRVR